jgi:hypothetical protein
MKEYTNNLMERLKRLKINESTILYNKTIFLKEQKFLKNIYS